MVSEGVLADHVLQAINSGQLDQFAGPGLKRLNEMLAVTLSKLREVPSEWQANIRRTTDPGHYAPRGEPLRLLSAALEEIDAHLGFLAHGNAYKLAALIEDAVDGLNRRRFTTGVSAARAITETSAVLDHWIRKLRPHLEAISTLKPSRLRLLESESRDGHAGTLKTLLDAMAALRSQSQLSKWNWLVFTGDAPVVDSKKIPAGAEQINVLTAIDKMSLSRSYGGRTLRVFYDALCDCVHPNRGSYMLFMDTCETTDVFWKPLLCAQPAHEEAMLTALALLAVPLQEMVPAGAAIINEIFDWHGKVRQLRSRLRAYL